MSFPVQHSTPIVSIYSIEFVSEYFSVKYTEAMLQKDAFKERHKEFFANFELLLTSYDGVANDITPTEMSNLELEIDMDGGLKEMLPNIMATLFKGEFGGFGAAQPRLGITMDFVNCVSHTQYIVIWFKIFS
jgi:hypothetical protein